MVEFPLDSFYILLIMFLYGLVSGGSAILLKKGIFQAGGIKIQNFFKDIFPETWRLIKTPIWMWGGVTAISGFLIYTIALNNYDISIVKPLVNTNLLFTFIFAFFIFQERLKAIEWIGVVILIVGLLLIAFSPNVIAINPSSISIHDQVDVPLLFTIFPLTIILVIIMAFLMFVARVGEGYEEYVFPLFSGTFYGFGTFFTKSFLIAINHINTADFFPLIIFIYSLVMFLLTYGFAIIAQQLAFEKGRLSIVSPIANSLSVTVAFLGAYFLFFEDLIVPIEGEIVITSYFKVLGLVCIILALFLLRREITPTFGEKGV